MIFWLLFLGVGLVLLSGLGSILDRVPIWDHADEFEDEIDALERVDRQRIRRDLQERGL